MKDFTNVCPSQSREGKKFLGICPLHPGAEKENSHSLRFPDTLTACLSLSLKTSFWLWVGVACLLMLSACAQTSGPAVQEIDTPAEAGVGDRDLEREVKEAKKEAKQEVASTDPEVQEAVQGAQEISVDKYLERFPQPRDKYQDYTVGGNDILGIKVYNEPELTQEKLRVSSDGLISFPFIGKVKVAGQTTSEIEDEITSRLSEGGYFIRPHISVRVEEYRSKKVLVMGAVENPGSYSLEEAVQVLDIISQAGGIDSEEAGRMGILVRKEKTNGQSQKLAVQIDLSELLSGSGTTQNLYLKDKDVLYVPKAGKIFIIGQVQEPGEYTLGTDRLSLMEAIGLAGGFTRIAARSKVRVVRQTGEGEKTLVVNVQAITERGRQGQDVELQAGDVVVVPESFF